MGQEQRKTLEPSRRLAELPRIVILADDLSSATDCGVQMASGGYSVAVPLNAERLAGIETDILSLDIDSRVLTAEQAYSATRAAIDALHIPKAAYYKSVDSTLRGNLGAEIAACLDTHLFKAAIVAPAFPTYGRTTWHGLQHVNGVPVAATEFGSDPGSPVKASAIRERIAEQCAYRAELVPLSALRQDWPAVGCVLEDGMERGISLFIFDALEESDLEQIALKVSRLPHAFLWVGSTGLSRYLPNALSLPRQAKRERISVDDGLVLIVAGSASETTHWQLDACARRAGFAEVRVDCTAIARGGESACAEIARTRRALEEAARHEPNTLALTLRSSRSDIALTKELALNRGLSSVEISQTLVDTLARLTLELLDTGLSIKGMILTGGATAKTIAAACKTDSVSIIEEVEPGIPLAAMNGPHAKLLVIKAGGFGNQDTLVKSVEKIRDYGRV